VKKDSIALQKKSPKLVLLGGSNVIFGISAKEIEQQTGIPTVNYGVHAGLKDYTFEHVKRVVQPGDTVLLSLEYEYYWYEKKFLLETQTKKERYILTHDPEYFKSLSFLERMHIVLIGGEDLILNIRSQARPPRNRYNVETQNDWGDETINTKRQDFIPYGLNLPDNFMQDPFKYTGMRTLVEFAIWCRNNDIKLLASYPSTIYFDKYENQDYKDFFRLLDATYTQLGVEMIGTPQNFFYDEMFFYDTRYHLIDDTRRERTAFLIEKMQPFFSSNKNATTANSKYETWEEVKTESR
jgi:hypothetical protein